MRKPAELGHPPHLGSIEGADPHSDDFASMELAIDAQGEPGGAPRPPHVSVLVPAHNEEGTIEPLLGRAERALASAGIKFEIIVIDDGSTDRTLPRAVGFARNNGGTVRILPREDRRGKGAALSLGALEARGDIVAVLDADLEYAPEDLVRLVTPIQDGTCDVVFGSRFVGQADGMTVSHRLGNEILTRAANLLFKGQLTDVMTGDKAFSRDALRALNVSQLGFGFEVEVAAKALKLGLRVKEIPITYHRRAQGVSKIKWRDGIKSLLHLIELARDGPAE